MKLLFALGFSILLTACAGPYIPHLSYLRKAETAISEQKWQLAYRFLEDGLISPEAEARERATALYRAHPNVRHAAAQTFSAESLRKSFDDNGATSATSIERNRLRMYAAVASDDELAVAANNFQDLVDHYQKAKQAEKVQQDAETLAAKNRLDAQAQAAKSRLDTEAQAAKIAALALQIKLEESQVAAFFKCKDKAQCDKAFALTQIFIASHSDMKIQMANDTIIETYNPSKEGAMGASAFKLPKEGTSAEIRLSVSCKSGVSTELFRLCTQDSIRINLAFPRFIRERLLN